MKIALYEDWLVEIACKGLVGHYSRKAMNLRLGFIECTQNWQQNNLGKIS
jgi:hypothetical protein